MGYDWKSQGIIQIKEGVTLEELVNAFYDFDDAEQRFDLADIMLGGGYELRDDIDFAYDEEARELRYSVDSNSGGLDESWSSYLDVIAEKYAAAGWEDYRGDDEEPTFMGPTPEAIRSTKIAHYLGVIEHAMAAIKAEL